MKPRHFLLALGLAASLAAAFWPRPQDEVVGAVTKRERSHQPADVTQVAKGYLTGQKNDRQVDAARQPDLQRGGPRPLEKRDAPQLGAMRSNLFPAQTWRPPPPPPPKLVPLPPPPPVAPPLPFQYLGRWKEGGKDVIFLAQGNRVLHARVGDSLSGWHFDQATDTDLVFTWAALNMQQILRIAP